MDNASAGKCLKCIRYQILADWLFVAHPEININFTPILFDAKIKLKNSRTENLIFSFLFFHSGSYISFLI